MAMFDFLNQPVGGTGQQDVSSNSMTWGQFINAISSMDGQGSQGGNLMSNPFTQFNQGLMSQGFNQSNAPYIQGKQSSFGRNTGQQDQQDIGQIMQLISLFGGMPGLGAEGGLLGPTTTMTGTGMFAG